MYKKASTALRQKRKPVALSHLHAHKQLEGLLNKRLGSLHTLYSTVEIAAGDVKVRIPFSFSITARTPYQLTKTLADQEVI